MRPSGSPPSRALTDARNRLRSLRRARDKWQVLHVDKPLAAGPSIGPPRVGSGSGGSVGGGRAHASTASSTTTGKVLATSSRSPRMRVSTAPACGNELLDAYDASVMMR